MIKQYFSVAKDGFCAAYYPIESPCDSAFILALGDSVDNRMVLAGVKWLQGLSCNVLAVAPEKSEQGFHNLPLERFGAAIQWLQSHGNRRIGIAGASITGMLALIAASYYPQITLTIAFTPCDFVAEGYYRDGLDGAGERPGEDESTVTWNGRPLPFLPYAYRHPEYWLKTKEESKKSGNIIACRPMFDLSEQMHPLTEAEMIKTERIRGTLILVGAEDDCLWDSCRYIRRIENRLSAAQASSRCISMLYEHGTHFLSPESMFRRMLPFGSGLIPRVFKAGRQFPRECKNSRLDLDVRITKEIRSWLSVPAPSDVPNIEN